jgi:hypothetical protein
LHGRNFRGLLADNNLEGHVPYLRRLVGKLGLWGVIKDLGLELKTFSDLGTDRGLDDRTLWRYCQAEQYVLITDHRNQDAPDSLEATLRDSWHDGLLPVITLASKDDFEHNPDHARRVASDVAEILFGIAEEQMYRDRPRIWVPFPPAALPTGWLS